MQKKRPVDPDIASWENLHVWQKAHQLVLRIYAITRQFPAYERFRLSDQLCRAAISVPTNIAEGKGRFALGDYLRFLCIARGSIEEVRYLLLLARDVGYLDGRDYTALTQQCVEIGKMLNQLIYALRQHLPKP